MRFAVVGQGPAQDCVCICSSLHLCNLFCHNFATFPDIQTLVSLGEVDGKRFKLESHVSHTVHSSLLACMMLSCTIISNKPFKRPAKSGFPRCSTKRPCENLAMQDFVAEAWQCSFWCRRCSANGLENWK